MNYTVILVAREPDGSVFCGRVPAVLLPEIGMRLQVRDDKVIVVNIFRPGHDLEDTDLPMWEPATVAPAR